MSNSAITWDLVPVTDPTHKATHLDVFWEQILMPPILQPYNTQTQLQANADIIAVWLKTAYQVSSKEVTRRNIIHRRSTDMEYLKKAPHYMAKKLRYAVDPIIMMDLRIALKQLQ